MSRAATLDTLSLRREPVSPRHLFVAVTLLLTASAALLAGWAPLGFSIVTVFLFAGPHNWLEFRYFLSRMPARWGRLRGFFLFSFIGIFLLAASFAGLHWWGATSLWFAEHWATFLALWNTLFLVWLVTLIQMRSRQRPYRDWFWTWPVAFLLLAATWLWPMQWGFGMVYLHPLIALWILDRELRRSRPELRGVYHCCLACLPLFLGLLWWRLADVPSLPGDDFLSQAITLHAGAGFLGNLNSHLLVSTHTFLEMLHYGVWVLAIPLVGMKTAPWKISSIPMTWRSRGWKFALGGALVLSGAVVLLLWSCFLADYPATRDVYFTVALLHVLAEAPFLLRALETLMDPAYLWAFLLKGYFFTILIETPILLVGLSPRHSLKVRLFCGVWLTACTYPIVVLVLPLLFAPEERVWYLLVAESVAHFGECALFWLAFGSREERWKWSMWRDLGAVFGANLASFVIGELSYYDWFGT